MLGIFDDIFPYDQSGWRYDELNAHLKALPSKVLSTMECANYGSAPVDSVIKEWEQKHPHLAGRIEAYGKPPTGLTLAYSLFLLGTAYFQPFFRNHQLPYVWCLYPGGGFHLGETHSDQTIKQLTLDPLCRKVISTQRVTTNYLLNLGIPSGIIEEIVGGVYGEHLMNLEPCSRGELPVIVFAGRRYWMSTKYKGFDIFAAAAKELKGKAQFIAITDFTYYDVQSLCDVDDIKFLPLMPKDEFTEFVRGVYAVMFAGEPAIGSFEGFPNGVSVTASLSGATMILTDPVGQNIHYTSGEDILIVTRDSAIEQLKSNLHRLAEIGLQGQQTTRKYYSPDMQIKPRIELLKSFM